TGVDDERASLGEAALAAGECVRVELRRRRVPVDASADIDAVLAEPLAAWDDRDHVLVQVIFTTVPFSRPPYGKARCPRGVSSTEPPKSGGAGSAGSGAGKARVTWLWRA